MTPRTAVVLVVAGVIGWTGWILLAARMLATSPPTAGFDLNLLIEAGRDVATGRSPYDPAIVAGSAPVAENLFYSYPPIVAQAMALVSGLPAAVIFVVWDALAVAGFAAISAAIWRTVRGSPGRDAAVAAIALTPFIAPLSIGLLFGNLDVFFPLLYGAVLLAWLRAGSDRAQTLGGSALAVASVSKLHPALLGLTALVAIRSSRYNLRMVGAAIAAVVAVVVVSLLAGAPLWADYAQVLRAGSGAAVVDPRNAAPAAQLALALAGSGGSGESLARSLQLVVTLVAIGGAVLVGFRSPGPVARFTVAAAASLVVLPVTWFHYPSALLPAAVAALALAARGVARPRSIAVLVAAGVLAFLALFWLPLLYVAAGLVVFAAWTAGEAARKRGDAAAAANLHSRPETGGRRALAAREDPT